ncbi:MAG: hypothetical protein QM538_03115 [Methylacidiphilales bacterium]|nr:hypothetical protein [Candidatus Methylacidiphilales bacterium]
MLVKTPVVQLQVSLQKITFTENTLHWEAVANVMPCAVSITAPELRSLLRIVLRPTNLYHFVLLLFK